MSITVINPGLQTTVQDLSRDGYAHFGISPSGAADSSSLRLGNIIVGNNKDSAGLEMTIIGGTFQFSSDAIIAITGSRFQMSLDNDKIPHQNHSLRAKKHDFLLQKIIWFSGRPLTLWSPPP